MGSTRRPARGEFRPHVARRLEQRIFRANRQAGSQACYPTRSSNYDILPKVWGKHAQAHCLGSNLLPVNGRGRRWNELHRHVGHEIVQLQQLCCKRTRPRRLAHEPDQQHLLCISSKVQIQPTPQCGQLMQASNCKKNNIWTSLCGAGYGTNVVPYCIYRTGSNGFSSWDLDGHAGRQQQQSGDCRLRDQLLHGDAELTRLRQSFAARSARSRSL